MFDAPRTAQRPGTVARQVQDRTAHTAQQSRSAVSVRLLVGTIVAAGSWLSAGGGSAATSWAKEVNPLAVTTSRQAPVASANYWQGGFVTTVNNQGLLGPLEWSSDDVAWTSDSPGENVRHTPVTMNRAWAATPPTPSLTGSHGGGDLFTALAATASTWQAATPTSKIHRDALPAGGDLLDALAAVSTAAPRLTADLTAGLPTAMVPAVAPEPPPTPLAGADTQPVPREAVASPATTQPNGPIHFDALATANADKAAVQIDPQGTDMAGPLALAHPNVAKAAEPSAAGPADAGVASAGASGGQAPPTAPLDTSKYVLPEAVQSPAVPSEFLASRFGSAVPIVRIAQAAPTETSSQDAAGPAGASPPAAAGGADEDQTLATAEKLGDEPVSNRLEFLRTETVLLDSGEWQIDVGLSYLLFEDDVPVVLLAPGGGIASVVQGKLKERRLFVPLAVRYGLNRRTQLFCDIPLGWANTELSLTGSDDYDHSGGVGDIIGGATFLLRQCNNESIVLTVAGTIPTGGNPYDENLVFQGAALGEGFWTLSADALCIRTIDPVVVFYGVGTRHYFEREYDGSEIKPGGEYRYQLGLGLAVNPRVTLSTRFAGSYVSELRVDDTRIPGTLQEPMSIRLAATISQQCRFVEPFVEFGITDDAAASYFGIVWTY